MTLNKKRLKAPAIFVVIMLILTIISVNTNASIIEEKSFDHWESAEGVPYPKNESDNISRTPGESEYADFAIDSQNHPHVVWIERGKIEKRGIYYVAWDGEKWLTTNGSIYNPGTGNGRISSKDAYTTSLQIALDSTDNPHIVFEQHIEEDSVIYITKNDVNWVTADGTIWETDEGSGVVADNNSSQPHIAIDSNDNPHIVWFEGNKEFYDILYTTWNGEKWVNIRGEPYNKKFENRHITNSEGFSTNSNIALFEDKPHIVWIYHEPEGKRDVVYIRWDGRDWVTANGELYQNNSSSCNVSKSLDNCWFPRIALDSYGCPHLVWITKNEEDDTKDVVYVKWDGFKWLTADGFRYSTSNRSANVSQSDTKWTGYSTTIAIDKNDTPHIAWEDICNGSKNIQYCVLKDGKWVGIDGEEYVPLSGNTSIGATGSNMNLYKIMCDNNGNPMVLRSDYSYGNEEVILTKWNEDHWENVDGTNYNPEAGSINVSKTHWNSEDCSFEIDDDENVHLVWSDGSFHCPDTRSTDIFYLVNRGSGWVTVEGEPWNPGIGNANISQSCGESELPIVKIDSKGYPNIMWFDNGLAKWKNTRGNNYQLFMIKWNGETWVNVDGKEITTDKGSAVVSGLSFYEYSLPDLKFELDSKDNPHIVWKNNSSSYLTHREGSWVAADGSSHNSSIDFAPWSSTIKTLNVSLSIDLKDRPHVSWDKIGCDEKAKKVYVYLDDTQEGTWKTLDDSEYDDKNQTDFFENIPARTQIKTILDSEDNPHFTWTEIGENDTVILKYARWVEDKFITADGVELDPNSEDSGKVSILKRTENLYEWVIIPTISLGPENEPHLAWLQTCDIIPIIPDVFFETNKDVFYSRWNGEQWVNISDEPIEAEAGNANVSKSTRLCSPDFLYEGYSHDHCKLRDVFNPLIRIDKTGRPHIVWEDISVSGSSPDILYVRGAYSEEIVE